MQRLRELMAHGGIAILAVVFALAFATFNVALALAREVVSVAQQQTIDEEGGSALEFTIGDTIVFYAELLYYGIALVLLTVALYGVWWLTRRSARACPECRSSVPAAASVCRYCTADLSPPAADA